MSFSTYEAFRVAVQQLIDSEASTEATFDTNILDTMILLSEDRVYLGDATVPPLRASSMIQPLSITATNGIAPLPADLIELHSVGTSDDDKLEIIPLADIGRYRGQYHCAQDGDTLLIPDSYSGPVVGRYYARPDPLKTELNAAFARYPSLYLYAALIECALFVGRTDMAEAWGNRYNALAIAAQKAERWRVYDGSRIRVKTH